MTDTKITMYPHITNVTGGSDIPLDVFLSDIQEGRWQDHVLKIRSIRDKSDRQEAKRKLLPYACLSGTFSNRAISGLLKHSGFICMDFDDVGDVELFKDRVSSSEYTYAAFVSCSGNGVAVLIRIDPDKHNEVFDLICEHFLNTFGAVASADKSCRDVSRARFVSFDPHLYINESSKKWSRVRKKEKVSKKIPKTIFVKSDFDQIIHEIQVRRIDICPAYSDWVKIGFALADKFGAAGARYFELISDMWAGGAVTKEAVSKQYRECLKDHGASNKITISTFYHYCSQHNIDLYSVNTKRIAQAATLARDDRRNKESALKYLLEEGYSVDECQDIVDQVYDNDISVKEDTGIELIESWLKYKYTVRRNTLSRAIEINGAAIDDGVLNDVWRLCNRVLEKTPFDTLKRIIISGFAADYNPVDEFIEKHIDRPSDPGIINRYCDCIVSDTGGDNAVEHVRLFVTKWLIGMVSNIYGDTCNLYLVLTGEQDTGKTEFFRRLLPRELKPYFAQSSMEQGKDDLILMTKRIIIFDDEMGGKTVKEEKKIKEITSKEIITVREPYGQGSVDMRRISTFCGCTNDCDEILNDPTGNRRIIPINVLNIDFTEIDKVDRVQLFIECYRLWKSGADWRLSKEAKKLLNDAGKAFESRSSEEEAILRKWRVPQEGELGEWVMAVDIMAHCQIVYGSTLRYGETKRALRKLGWKSAQKKFYGENQRRYYLVKM